MASQRSYSSSSFSASSNFIGDILWDLTEKHEAKVERAIENPADLLAWKEELLPRVREATASDDITVKIEMLSEVCMAFSAQLYYDAAIKTKALATVIKNRHGLSDEEVDKCLAGNNLTRLISTPRK